jgi:phosphoribosylglycinamide formyltransferase-1
MIRIALFASGSGTNVENIANHFAGHPQIEIVLVLSNNKNAFVLERSKKLQIPSIVFSRQDFYQTDEVLQQLINYSVDWVILAGFLWLIPQNLIQKFPDKIINIHPALLPKYGGKGMYGNKVHEAVVANSEKESGITIHFVNEAYDEGSIIFQEKITVLNTDTANDVAEKVHALEYKYFPELIEQMVLHSR